MTTATDARPAGVLEHIDPNTIVIEANVRPSAPLTKEFVQSIREHGVIMPTSATATPTATCSCAPDSDAPSALVKPECPRSPSTSSRATRTPRQHHRAVDRERAPRSPHRRRPRRRMAAARVRGPVPRRDRQEDRHQGRPREAGPRRGREQHRQRAIVEHQLDLEQAATLIEFEDDPEATAELIKIAKEQPSSSTTPPNAPETSASSPRRSRPPPRPSPKPDYEILERRPSYDENDCLSIHELRTAEGTRVDEETVATLDGRAATVTLWRADEEPSVDYFLRGWKEAGYTDSYASTGSGSNSGPMTDEQKAERKVLIANNKAWASAEVVRREWLVEFLSRKTLPKDAAQFIAQGLTMHRGDVYREMQGGNVLATRCSASTAATDGEPTSSARSSPRRRPRHSTCHSRSCSAASRPTPTRTHGATPQREQGRSTSSSSPRGATRSPRSSRSSSTVQPLEPPRHPPATHPTRTNLRRGRGRRPDRRSSNQWGVASPLSRRALPGPARGRSLTYRSDITPRSNRFHSETTPHGAKTEPRRRGRGQRGRSEPHAAISHGFSPLLAVHRSSLRACVAQTLGRGRRLPYSPKSLQASPLPLAIDSLASKAKKTVDEERENPC